MCCCMWISNSNKSSCQTVHCSIWISESNNDNCQAEWYMRRVFSAYLFVLWWLRKYVHFLSSSSNQNISHGPLYSIRSWRNYTPLIARFMGSTCGPSGSDRTQVGPMLAPWALLSGTICLPVCSYVSSCSLPHLHISITSYITVTS